MLKFSYRINFVKKLLKATQLAVVILFALEVSKAQLTYRPTDHALPGYQASGIPAGSYASGEFENINLFNRNLNFSLPIVSINGRGNTYFSINQVIERQWHIYTETRYSDSTPCTNPQGCGAGYISQYHYPYSEWQGNPTKGYMPGKLEWDVSADVSSCLDYTYYPQNSRFNYSKTTLLRLYFTDSNNTKYELRDAQTGGQPWRNGDACPSTPAAIPPGHNRGTTFISTDGSSMTFVSDFALNDDGVPSTGNTGFPRPLLNGYLLLKDGARYRIEEGLIRSIKDTNGNFTSFTYEYQTAEHETRLVSVKDSLNREIIIRYDVQDIAPYGLCNQFVVRGFGGQEKIIRISRSEMGQSLRADQTLKSLKQLFPRSDSSSTALYNPIIISAIWLPDGRSYRLLYNSYGQLARVELPIGGAYEYNYQSGEAGTQTEGGYYYRGGVIFYEILRPLTERRIYSDKNNANSLISTTTFSKEGDTSQTKPTPGGTILVETRDASNHLVSKTGHSFWSFITPFKSGDEPVNPGRDWFDSWISGKEYKTEFYALDGITVLRRVENQWEQGNPINWWRQSDTDLNWEPSSNPRVIEEKITFLDTNQVSKKTFSYDQFNNQTDIYEYDYGTGQAGAFLRRSHADFVTDANYTDYTGAHIRNLPLQTWVSSDINGNNKVSLSQIEYDNYTSDANHAPLVSRNNVIGFDAANYGATNTRRGNVTKVTSYSDAQNQTGAVIAYSQYDILGNVVKVIDARGNASTVDYTDRFGSPDGEARANIAPTQLNGLSTFAFPTSATNALSWITGYSQVDYFTGASVDAEDINGAVSSTFYNDTLDRPTQSITANNLPAFRRQATINYDDLNQKMVTTTADLYLFGDNLSKTESRYDGLGRTTETRKYENGSGTYVAVQTQYDALGRAYKQSNPFRPTEINAGNPIRWTTSGFDALGRVKEVETPDGAKVFSAYDGNRTLVTDQAGKQRISKTNALGQLKDVWEVTAADSSTAAVAFPNQPGITAGYQTSYQYDSLNNLKQVDQGQQTRTFSYDSLSRLKTATNPEMGTTPTNGTISYQYDNSGNLTQKTDARNVVTTYVYDALNRVTNRNYTPTTSSDNYQATPPVAYTYDGAGATIPFSKGKLTRVSNGTSTTEYTSFDSMGRVTASQQTTPGATFGGQTYTYNLSGALIEEKYPSGKVVKNVLDSDGDLAMVQSKKNGDTGFWNYAKSFTYTAAGAVSSMQLGNGKWESTIFNSRLQPTQIGLGTVQNGTDKLKLNFDYGTTNNNGNVLSQMITVPSETRDGITYAAFTATQAYTYDSLNRLKSAQETIPNQTGWKQTFKYDRYGNRNFDTTNVGDTTMPDPSCAVAVCNPSVDPLTNKLVGYQFDNAGNTKVDANGRSFTYDAENKQVKVMNGTTPIGEYFYDGDGKRVKKIAPDENGQMQTTVFVYDASGKLVAEYATNPLPAASAKVSYLTSDHLGSPRINTDQNGAVISRHDYHPFGEEIGRVGYGGDKVRKQFTSYERDNESDLDFAQARMYANKLGRFSSPDDFLNDTHNSDPQSWNLYAYVRNNPLKYVDITGKDLVLSILFSYTNIEDYQVVKSDNGTYKLVNISGGKDFEGKGAQVQFIENLINQQNPDSLNTLIGTEDVQNINIGIYEGIMNLDGGVNSLYGNGKPPDTVTGTDSFARVTSNEQASAELLKEVFKEIFSFLGNPLEASRRKLFNTPRIEIEPTSNGGVDQLGVDDARRQSIEQRNRSTVLNGGGRGISIPQDPVLPNIPPPPPAPTPRPR